MKLNIHGFKSQFVLFTIVLLISVQSAEAYIGPGAGFAFLSSFLIGVVTLALAILSLLSWPLRYVIRRWSRKQSASRQQVKRIIILGFDGMDPGLARQFMAAGKLPHFDKLKQQGTFAPLATSYPAISPSAWSSFMTGVDPSYHNIFDFINILFQG